MASNAQNVYVDDTGAIVNKTAQLTALIAPAIGIRVTVFIAAEILMEINVKLASKGSLGFTAV